MIQLTLDQTPTRKKNTNNPEQSTSGTLFCRRVREDHKRCRHKSIMPYAPPQRPPTLSTKLTLLRNRKEKKQLLDTHGPGKTVNLAFCALAAITALHGSDATVRVDSAFSECPFR